MSSGGGCFEVLITKPATMKLVVMVTLILSDADVFFTFASFEPYAKANFTLAPICICIFAAVYLLGTYQGNKQNRKFVKRLTLNVEQGLYRLPPDNRILDVDKVQGFTETQFRTFMVQNGLGDKYYQARSEFVRNVVKWKHSIPFLRLARFGWMADIPAGDFACILNSNALYSFTVGFAQLGCSAYYVVSLWNGEDDPAIIFSSMGISILSWVLSILNIAIRFPKVLNDLEERRAHDEIRKKEFERMVEPHISGLREKCEAEIVPLRGKADKTQEICDITKRYMELEMDFRRQMAEMHEKRADVIGGGQV